MARIKTVKKARKDQGSCGRCGVEIKRGDPYRWVALKTGPRSSRTLKRCASVKCVFRSSELTNSDKLSRVYGASEDASDRIDSWDGESIEELKDALQDAANEIKEVADEYEESANNIRDHIPDSATADDCEEKAEGLRSWGEEMECGAGDIVEFEDWLKDGTARDTTDEDELRKLWIEEMQGEATSKLEDCPV